MSTNVTRVQSDSDVRGGDPTWEIHVSRFPGQRLFAGTLPPATDVPADIRAALLEWLEPFGTLNPRAKNDRLRAALQAIADSGDLPAIDLRGMARAVLEATR